LFHKAVALSGNTLRGGDKDASEKLGSYVLKEARLNSSQLDKLQEMPWRDYYALTSEASRKMREESASGATGARGGFSPVADGVYLPQEPFYSGSLSSGNPVFPLTLIK